MDCTELFIEIPSHFRVQSDTYSSYKHHNTAKGLIGITPNGFISLASELVPGRMSDRDVTIQSGLIEKLEHGDSVMADRGFLIDDILATKRVGLNIPPFLNGKSQLSVKEAEETVQIARIRIHVERVIENESTTQEPVPEFRTNSDIINAVEFLKKQLEAKTQES